MSKDNLLWQSVWPVPPPDVHPEARLISWRVMRAGDSEHLGDHLVGYEVVYGEGRVSSKIAEFDPARMVAVTRSGRVYQLLGEPGRHPDADYVWELWSLRNGADAAVDVSHEYIGTIQPYVRKTYLDKVLNSWRVTDDERQRLMDAVDKAVILGVHRRLIARGWNCAEWLQTPEADLNHRRPLDLMLGGEADRVIEHLHSQPC